MILLSREGIRYYRVKITHFIITRSNSSRNQRDKSYHCKYCTSTIFYLAMMKSYLVSRKSFHRKVVRKEAFKRDRPGSLPCLAELQSEKGESASWKVAWPVTMRFYGGVRDHLTFGWRSVGLECG